MRTAATVTAAAPAWGGGVLSARAAQPASVSDEDLLAQAREGIEKHRKADGAVTVRGADGKPVDGATVTVEQIRHEFLFGCNLFGFGQAGDEATEAAYRERFAGLFNFATLGFYWAAYEKERGRTNHAALDRVLEWTSKQGIRCKGHPLVWDHPAGAPAWLPDDQDQVKALSDGRVREIMDRFRGRIDMWDVVNEPTHLPARPNRTKLSEWGAAMGSVIYTREPLIRARRANPGATLIVNDYRVGPDFLAVLEALKDVSGKWLFDVVGLQSHMHDQTWSMSRLREVCDRFAKLKLPMHFTEITVPTGARKGPGDDWHATDPEREAAQAAYLENLYTMLFGTPLVKAVTWWDLSDHGAWQGAAAGLIRKDMSPKPGYERLRELIRGAWWTKEELTSDANGTARVRAFAGRQRLKAVLPDGSEAAREVDWKIGLPNRFELKASR